MGDVPLGDSSPVNFGNGSASNLSSGETGDTGAVSDDTTRVAHSSMPGVSVNSMEEPIDAEIVDAYPAYPAYPDSSYPGSLSSFSPSAQQTPQEAIDNSPNDILSLPSSETPLGPASPVSYADPVKTFSDDDSSSSAGYPTEIIASDYRYTPYGDGTNGQTYSDYSSYGSQSSYPPGPGQAAGYSPYGTSSYGTSAPSYGTPAPQTASGYAPYGQPPVQWQQPPASNGVAQPYYNSPYAVPAVAPYGQMYAPRKSKVAAALLAFFLGSFGVHNFYLGYSSRGAVQLILTIVGWLTSIILIGLFVVAAVGLWAFVEFILILVGGSGYNVDSNGNPLDV